MTERKLADKSIISWLRRFPGKKLMMLPIAWLALLTGSALRQR